MQRADEPFAHVAPCDGRPAPCDADDDVYRDRVLVAVADQRAAGDMQPRADRIGREDIDRTCNQMQCFRQLVVRYDV
nr:hypothetical protein [Burkholderia multivorans]